MKLSERLLIELQHESAATKKYLEIVPVESYDWKPHPKSMSLGNLAGHVAEIPAWLKFVIEADEFNLAAMNYKPPVPTDMSSLIQLFQEKLEIGTNALKNASDETLRANWTLRKGDHVILQMSRMGVVRNLVYNHFVHHRGQLSVYLRLLDVKIPGLYGPSADDIEPMG